MKALHLVIGLSLAALLTACETTEQALDKQQTPAIATVTKRAQFEMNCPDVTGAVLTRNMVEAPPMSNGPMMQSSGPNVAQYSVGMTGCGQKRVYEVLCQSGRTTCTALSGAPGAMPPR